MNNNQYPFINTPLPYDYQALEPYIDATTMYLHHEKHLQAYIDNLNKLLAKEPKLQACTPLPYDYQALEPYIDATTMYLHHEKHLQAYIDNLNKLLAKEPKLQACTLEELTQMPGDIGKNSGGVYNHRFYFEGLQPPKKVPHNPLYEEIESQFQSFEAFQKIFKQTALSVFGSGYAWLVWERGMLRIITTANQGVPCLNKQSFEAFQKIFKQTALSVFGSGYAWLVWERGMLRIITTANQGVPCLNKMFPILCIDVWEHAYYLKHYNLRGDYIDNWFKVINWDTAQMGWQQGEPFTASVIE